MTDHLLDNPAWESLTTDHARFNTGEGLVRRYQPDVSPFAALETMNAASLEALRDCVHASGAVVLARAAHSYSGFEVPSGLRSVWDRAAIQMVFAGDTPKVNGSHEIDLLRAADASEMLALALLTKPGPFAAQTHEMGHYWGVRSEGRLIAMAGERLRQPGFTEISAICTHPDHQGKGLGRALTLHVIRAILERGETPFLHVFSDNEPAIALYERLGFRWRQDFRGMELEAVPSGAV